MIKFILLEGNHLTPIENIKNCRRSLQDDWYLDENGKNRQWFCELTNIQFDDEGVMCSKLVFHHVFDDFIKAIEEGMKSDDPIIKPRTATKDDWY